jgi:cell division GTPase FtsZ
VTAITFRRNSGVKKVRSLYFRSTLGVRKGSGDEARRIAANITKLPESLVVAHNTRPFHLPGKAVIEQALRYWLVAIV